MVFYGYSPQVGRWYLRYFGGEIPELPNDISYWAVPGTLES